MNDEELKQQVSASMQDLIEGIDGATEHKLNQARYQAINQAPKSGFEWSHWSLASSAALGIIAVLGILFFNATPDAPLQAETYAMLEDIELLANDSDPEFYQELEFLDWLDRNQLLDKDI